MHDNKKEDKKMKRTARAVCSLLLALSLALGMMPGAFAQDEPEEAVPGYRGNGMIAHRTPLFPLGQQYLDNSADIALFLRRALV